MIQQVSSHYRLYVFTNDPSNENVCFPVVRISLDLRDNVLKNVKMAQTKRKPIEIHCKMDFQVCALHFLTMVRLVGCSKLKS